MSTPNVNIIFQGLVALVNNLIQNAPQLGVFDFNNPTLGATSYFHDPFFQAPTSLTAIPIPASKVYCIMVQNVSVSTNLTVVYVPFGGSATTCILGPGGVLVLFDPTEQSAGGFTALSLAGVGSTCSAAVLVGV